MVIGSGLLAKAFADRFGQPPGTWIYAAGVSNSGCTDPVEFERERVRLARALDEGRGADAFVYFSTCSIGDPAAAASDYVRHKMAMEALVAAHPRHIIARLPQIAGHTPNPHTLLNFLHASISRSERFTVWRNASRNIIDVDDVARIVGRLVDQPQARAITVNVANTASTPVPEIVAAMERALGKPAVADWRETGSAYEIDVSGIAPVIDELGLRFDGEYLPRIIHKYYR